MRSSKVNYYKNLQKLLSMTLFISGIVPILIISSTSIYNSKQVAIRDAERTISQIVVHRRDVINSFLQHQVDSLVTLIDLYHPDFFTELDNLNLLFRAMSTSGAIVDMQTIAANGQQLAYVGPYRDEVSGRTYEDQDWFKEVLVRGVYVSDIFFGYRDLPHFVVALTDPLKSYVLRTTINSSVFNSLLHSAQMGRLGDVFIINREGEFQTPSLHNSILSEFERGLVASHSGATVVRKGDYLYATTWLEGNNWLLLFKVHLPEVLTAYHAHLKHVVWILALTTMFFVLLSFYLGRYIVKRISGADLEHARINQQLAHVEKLANIGRLATGIAHEINNPLQLITAQVSWMNDLLPEENKHGVKHYHEYLSALNNIKHHVGRAGNITHRLLGFARKINEEPTRVDVNLLLEETISFLTKDAELNNIKLYYDFSSSLPVIFTEGPRLQQVLLNLIENALDAVDKNGNVTIKSTADQDSIFITIEDDGPGISPEVMPRIWDPFFTTKAQGKGTGLGLSISQNIMQSLGGHLQAANRDGGGTSFTVSLPIARA